MINQAFVYSKSNKLFVHSNMLNTEDQSSFGEWLRNKIKENGISNAELARRVDLSPTYIGNLVRDFSPNSKTGKIRASEEVVKAISNALNADLNEARIKAGYASLNAADSYEILEGVNVSFDETKLNKDERERILDAMRLIAGGIRAEKERN